MIMVKALIIYRAAQRFFEAPLRLKLQTITEQIPVEQETGNK